MAGKAKKIECVVVSKSCRLTTGEGEMKVFNRGEKYDALPEVIAEASGAIAPVESPAGKKVLADTAPKKRGRPPKTDD